jgi:hypothetical protein
MNLSLALELTGSTTFPYSAESLPATGTMQLRVRLALALPVAEELPLAVQRHRGSE